ncbi:30S ribosomal protein S13 [Candidatus Woesearchaeota archaeon]|jgi:small subunit ribosomal protein S13|nr:30S ribosomal protein S13 [Candidatus Woesearchaeota archaeon]MBT3537538.1 30S ribosomal protein S13 [Candidatus Woesearchaeota archaeon]MBT4696842.1 30S ribosomal protein S13 [Candidatus Woesearchaeota archaeon]MBT7106152.1 30S ribosomal protein S13 [Candidatus Woesearchaeota archaeon]MBT7930950.1 30S ribosomal protein S13 [Candidatus Woesearchaeota archaeon]
MSEEKLKPIIRVVSTDIKGDKKLADALRKIKGIGMCYANAVCSAAGIDKNRKAGSLSDDEVKRLEAAIKKPLDHNLPSWMVNRRKDMETGEDMHILTSDLTFIQSNDIKLLQSVKCNIGLRHAWRLPVRGQRTQSNFRKNKGKVSIANKRKVMKH